MKPYPKYLLLGSLILLALLTALAVVGWWVLPREYEAHATMVVTPDKTGQ